MPYEKLKSENYTNFGGINHKTSQYVTDKNEFLKLDNVDFQVIGALTKSPGSAVYPFAFFTNIITGIQDFGYGSSNVNSASKTAATSVSNLYDFPFALAPRNVYDFIYPGNTQPFSFVGSNGLYGCNLGDFFYYNGNTTIQYGLPKPVTYTSTSNGTGTGSALNGALVIAYAWARFDGLIGPAQFASFAVTGQSFVKLNGIAINSSVGPGSGISAGSFGISGIQSWYSLNGGPFYPNTILSAPAGVTIGANTTAVLGYTTNDLIPDPEDYLGTFLYGTDANAGATTVGMNAEQNPKTIEIYNNQLFSSGFLFHPDEVWYSEIGEPEKHSLEGNFLFRANDGDRITCLKSFFTQLVVFKQRSFGVLSGTDPDTFVLSEISQDYGALTNNAACVWRNKLWFIGAAGICEFDGSNVGIVSDKLTHIFSRINLDSLHHYLVDVVEREEIWCAIAIDGSTYANQLIIFDYNTSAWSTKSLANNDQISSINQLRSGSVPGTYFGRVPVSASFSMNVFGASLATDSYGSTAGNFTCMIQSRFLTDMGNSITKMWRRLYLDMVVPEGGTYVIPVNFYRDQGTTYALQTTMVISEFQKRIDFGISAKDLSVEFIYSGSTFLQINGFTLEYRFQRAV